MDSSEISDRYNAVWSSSASPEEMKKVETPFQFWNVGLDSQCSSTFYRYCAIFDTTNKDFIYYAIREYFKEPHSIEVTEIAGDFVPNFEDFQNKTSPTSGVKRFEVRWWTECRNANTSTPFQYWQLNMRIPERLKESLDKEGLPGIPSERLLYAIVDAHFKDEIELEIKHNYFRDAIDFGFDLHESDYIPLHAKMNNDFQNRTKLYVVEQNKNQPIYCADPSKVTTDEVLNSVNNHWIGWSATPQEDGSIKLKFNTPQQK